MFEKIKQSKEIIRNILSLRNYLIIFLITSVFSFAIFYIFTVATVADQSLKIFIMMSGFWYTFAQLFILAVIAVLFGIYVSLFAYRIKLVKCREKKGIISSIFGGGGLIAGLFAAGCPMCGSVLFALVGAPLALFFLPFKGLELKVLSILLLFISIYLISRSLIECDIKTDKNKKN